ncbi:MAG: tetraacyldisaccharide 4'-kinase [bacterium]|nr:tetraacyldisaccharide 4'-kinase [bacterium]
MIKALVFWGLSWIGRAFYCGWKALYVTGIKKPYRSRVPVVSIGNLTVGGTGKTPVADWLVGQLESWGHRPALLSRGYGRGAGPRTLLLDATKPEGGPELYGDEPWLLHQHHPDLLLAIDSKRDRAAQLVENQVDLLLLDDGFQHWRIHRDLDLVLIDALAGLGNGARIPAGPLREPLSALKRAHALLVTKSNWADPAPLIARVRPYLAEGTPVFELSYRPSAWVALDGAARLAVSELIGRKVWAFCGIGNPQGFVKALEGLSVAIMGLTVLRDHQAYDAELMAAIEEQAVDAGAELLVCTEKDAVKLAGLASPNLGYLAMELGVPDRLTEFIRTGLDTATSRRT